MLFLVALVFIAARAAANYRLIFPPPVEPIPFNASEWKSPSSSDFDSDVRAAMLDDLLARHDFTGWSRTELESVLGPADDFDLESRSIEAPDRWDLGYRAGRDWIDYRVLVFDLDAEGDVVSYQVELY